MGIIEAITAFFKSIPIFNKWFTKNPEKKLEDRQEDTKDRVEHFKKTGRPKWD